MVAWAVSGSLLAGCWKDDRAEIPADELSFQPETEAPLGWVVAPIEVPLDCPDGTRARFFVLYPDEAADTPLPVALMLHSGSWDFVFAPDASSPLLGTHFRAPDRLTAKWAARQVFVHLGMYPEQDETELHEGLLPAAFADDGVAVMLPANCWGDLWANKRGGSDNDFSLDFYFREGLAAVEWAYRFLVDPAFAAALDVTLPITADPAQIFGVGLGEGGRGIVELAAIDNDDDGVGDYPLAGMVVDSPPDDLRVYFDNPALYASTVAGLQRIFPAGPDATARGSVWGTPTLPERIGYIYSTADSQRPAGQHTAALARLDGMPGAWTLDTAADQPVAINGGDADLAAQVVQFLRNGALTPNR